mmetsp:Transcript_30706/g.78490  ORF Transcript_30706/g.78490 Transcript_30706/m.78490 type:complete len:208 (+) Transcript_30706:726-1349(+)
MTRLVSSLGTGNRCLRMAATRPPSADVKASKMRCGYASLMVPTSFFCPMSWRSTVPWMPKYAVGPYGRWHTTMPSGSPRCSCSTTMSVKSCERHVSTNSDSTMPPRLMRCALGITSFISLANCTSRLLGSRLVVTSTLGSASPACAYSSSTCVRCTAVLSSSSSTSLLSLASSFLTSVGRGLPSSSAFFTSRFRSYAARSLPSRLFL